MQVISFYNRYTQQLETEQIYGEGFLKFIYQNPLGKLPLHTFVKRHLFSQWYGKRMDQPSTRQKIAPFIDHYQLDPEDFLETPESYPHFNAFFSRKLKSSARPTADSAIVFPADGRHLGFEHAEKTDSVFVKNQHWDLRKLIDDDTLYDQFRDGSLILSRLCPVDYHRFHFPAGGTPTDTTAIGGHLYSVSPLALRQKLHYLWHNKRTRTLLRTETLGDILILEIGATCVGSIHQTYTPHQPVTKAEEKGYFSFGGSSTITLFEADRVKLATDLLEHSAQQTELYAHMGDHMASPH